MNLLYGLVCNPYTLCSQREQTVCLVWSTRYRELNTFIGCAVDAFSSNLVRDNGCVDGDMSWFYSVSVSKCRDITSNRPRPLHFEIPSNSSVTLSPDAIRSGADSIVGSPKG
jgi:hypothetical protein